MDEIMSFLSMEPQPKPIIISGGSVSGRVILEDEDDEIDTTREFKSIAYDGGYEAQLQNDLIKKFHGESKKTDNRENEHDPKSVYNRYNFNICRNKKTRLPIEDSKQEILEKVRQYPVIVLQGSTGCGKTTQVPQYILDEARQERKYCNIVVAQPRRMAASSNATRVCRERGWPLGSVVGYQVGSDQRYNQSEDTRILYCTTGILLERFVHSKTLYPFTHIILDEVHERTKEMDFLMVIVKKFMHRNTKIILMSATIDSNLFSDYFKMPIGRNSAFVAAPEVYVDAQRNFMVSKFFLDDMVSAFPDEDLRQFSFNMKKPSISEEVYKWAIRLIILFERLDWCEASSKNVSREEFDKQQKPTILVFLPGINEINIMYRLLEEWKHLNRDTSLVRIILHSTSSSIQSDAAMQETKTNIRKVILATNIAESSVTVPGVKYVIDFCLTRNLVTDPETNFTSLRLAWASRNNCEQRAGRTGRMMNGFCYRLVTKDFYLNQMQSTTEPEIVNNPLEDVILKAKILNIGPPESLLALAMEKPKLSDVGKTVLRLKEAGALFRTTSGIVKMFDGDITFIGRVMSSLPLDIKLSKLIVFGYCFSVLDECIVIAAALNCTKRLFKWNSNDPIGLYEQMLEWADGSGSDLFAMLNAYTTWSSLHLAHRFGRSDTKKGRDEMNENERIWCNRFGLEVVALRECKELIADLKKRLKRLRLHKTNRKNNPWTDNEKNVILKLVIGGAFYPNYFLRSSPKRLKNERDVFETLNGRDPTNTVYFTGFESKYIREIYVKSIKKIFVESGVVDSMDKLNVSFDYGSQKVFVTFTASGKKDDARDYGVACMPGFVLTEVYKAIKMRHRAIPMRFPVFENSGKAIRFARAQNVSIDETTYAVQVQEIDDIREICYPRILDKKIVGHVTHIEDCDHFYFQPKDAVTQIHEIDQELNRNDADLSVIESIDEIEINEIYAVKFSDEKFYRGKVLSVKRSNLAAQPKLRVWFVDFGNTEECNLSDIRSMDAVGSTFIRLPPKCFRCALAGVQPSILNAPNGAWPDMANIILRDETNTEDGVQIEVYSICNGIVRVTILVNNKNINEYLIKRSLADRCEENYMSKSDHMMRAENQSMTNFPNGFDGALMQHLRQENMVEIEPPELSHSRMTNITLRGPLNPLEINVYPMTTIGIRKTVSIDPHSVNSVLLENEPNDISNKYLVAVSISEEERNDKIVLRHTTLMPHIRGFGIMVAALFSPEMELKTNKLGTSYTGMIVGLGRDDSDLKPILAENDMSFEIDAEFDPKDFKLINDIRHCMNTLLLTQQDQELAANFNEQSKVEVIRKIKEFVEKLLIKKRKMQAYSSERIQWGYKDEVEYVPQYFNEDYGDRAIFPLHEILSLKEQSAHKIFELQAANKKLHEMAKWATTTKSSIKCVLCNDPDIENTNELQHHLISRLHRDREQAIEDYLADIFDEKNNI